MREFHKIMFEYNARLKYTDSNIEVFLDNPCSLKAIKDLAEAFYIEFGTPSDKIKLESASNDFIRLVVPIFSSNEDSAETEREEAKEDKNKSEYHKRVLNTALEILSERENGLTPTELQQELAKRGVVASVQWIGQILTDSGKALKVGQRWYIKDSARETINQDSWSRLKPLTDKVGYKIENGNVVLVRKISDNRFETYKTVPYKLLEDLYKVLPDEANSNDVNAVATAVGIESVTNFETYLMRILANEFGGKLRKIGRSFILVKGDNNA